MQIIERKLLYWNNDKVDYGYVKRQWITSQKKYIKSFRVPERDLIFALILMVCTLKIYIIKIVDLAFSYKQLLNNKNISDSF